MGLLNRQPWVPTTSFLPCKSLATPSWSWRTAQPQCAHRRSHVSRPVASEVVGLCIITEILTFNDTFFGQEILIVSNCQPSSWRWLCQTADIEMIKLKLDAWTLFIEHDRWVNTIDDAFNPCSSKMNTFIGQRLINISLKIIMVPYSPNIGVE